MHAEQHLVLHRPLPLSGRLSVTARVGDILDKGSGAVVWTETTAVDPRDRDAVVSSRSASFIRGEGGFGGDRGSSEPWEPPTPQPDHVVPLVIRPEQALLYRLNGDRNPLHSDPAFAARGGFDRPILHGMCTFGFTCRALVAAVAGGTPSALTSIGGRFSEPGVAGEEPPSRSGGRGSRCGSAPCGPTAWWRSTVAAPLWQEDDMGDARTPIDQADFREVMGQYPTGVVVITALSASGEALGMTVGSFNSVSLDPALVMFMPDKQSSSWKALAGVGDGLRRQRAQRRAGAGLPGRRDPQGGQV